MVLHAACLVLVVLFVLCMLLYPLVCMYIYRNDFVYGMRFWYQLLSGIISIVMILGLFFCC